MIGFLTTVMEDSDVARTRMATFRMGLADEGLIEEANYSLANRFLEGDFSRIVPFVRELGSLRPRVGTG